MKIKIPVSISKHNLENIRPELRFTALFLAFALFFSSFHSMIADYAAWLLAMTHEISLAPANPSQTKGQGQSQTQPQQHAPVKITAMAQVPAPKNKVAERATPTINKKPEVSDKPETVNLPKTNTPVISIVNGIPGWSSSDIALFPPLRKFDGTAWNEEKTEIKIASDGKTLFVLLRVYDKNPSASIIGDPQKRKGKGLWDTDSIEFFLMKNSRSNHYCQYIISVSGNGQTLYNKIADRPNSWQSAVPPKSFELPRFSADEFDGGFELEIKIALSNIDVDMLKPGDSLLMQIVRNYRGQTEINSVTLQLFPVYIYADRRFGTNNHDRRAFQEIPVRQEK
ncbi:MAG: sugar-binding protein [Victivallales bacterium]